MKQYMRKIEEAKGKEIFPFEIGMVDLTCPDIIHKYIARTCSAGKKTSKRIRVKVIEDIRNEIQGISNPQANPFVTCDNGYQNELDESESKEARKEGVNGNIKSVTPLYTRTL
jgi:hypothetical protein